MLLLREKKPNIKAIAFMLGFKDVGSFRRAFRGWTGKVELGGSISTGNTDEQALAVAVDLDRKTPDWDHDLNVTVDRKIESGESTTARYFLAYSIQRTITPLFYVVGVLWGERDIFAGYDFRFSESVGLGYRLVDSPDLKFRLEAGPAVRQLRAG